MEADLGDELVALDARAGKCFGFNEVAATVWRSLEQPKTFDELRAELVDAYEVDEARCSADLRELLDSMSAKGLIHEQPASGNKPG